MKTSFYEFVKQEENMIIKFRCESCNEVLSASCTDDDMTDKVHCNCGRVYVVLKPFVTTDTNE